MGMVFRQGEQEGLGALRRSARNGARPSPSKPIETLQQARTPETLNRICYRQRLTLENPARHRDSQCRIAQMPEFHKSLPTPEPHLGSAYRGPVVTQS